ncbi:MAG: DUF1580 domain-containing protein [Pirellulaceae bacterium]
MVDAFHDTLLSITQTAHQAPGRPHISTVWRWINRGVRGVKLETVMIGGRRFTSREALDRFYAATTAATSGESIPVRTNRQRTRDIEQARRELAEAGI